MATFGLADIPAQMRALYEENAENPVGGGWRAVGEKAGISGAYARLIAMGERPLTPSVAGAWLAEVDFVPTKRIRLCPTCDGDHGLNNVPDCQGKPVSAIVALAPGETIRKPVQPPTRSPRKSIHLTPDTWQRLNAARLAAGETWDEYLSRLKIDSDILDNAR